MAKSLQAIRGMNDLQPEDTPVWRYVENIIRHTLDQYGFQEIRTPVVEPTQLFQRSVGEHTDIVEKEMYTFNDRSNESLTLRPEFTAGIVRAGIEHGLFYNQVRRLWTMGQLFRYERPQKGRYRQFHQLSVEIFGLSEAEADAELILLSARLWKTFGIADKLTLELNTLGSSEERKAYREALVNYCMQHKEALDEDSRRRLETNPLRILDSKDKTTRALLENAPRLDQFLGHESQQYFEQICTLLEENGISYVINRQLVRGLDYYCQTVFEWTTDALGAQGTVCGGGRYDLLAEMLGGKPTPACGFGLGMERLILLILQIASVPEQINRVAD
ncbi:MAG: histidine--tRNA ligase, partial [Endozoicomonadaceae bacterium]|nr:histidine--tRNA ligase [Endozoicomonadaceae bacterium]